MKLKTKIIALAVASMMALSAVSAFAAPTWQFFGYDLTNGAPYPVLEYEVDENGLPTNNVRMNGFASKVEWKHAFYEAAFPHVGYNRLFLDDQAQDLYAPSAIADSVQDYRPVFWEAKSPYAVYDVMYSSIPGVMDWTVQPNYVRFGNRNAAVAKQWVPFGFSAYMTTDDLFVDASDFLNALGASRFERAGVLDEVNASYNYLNAISGTVQPAGFEFPYEMRIPRVDQESLTGPAYEGGAEVGTMTVKPVDRIIDAFGTNGNYNDALFTNDIRNANRHFVENVNEAMVFNSYSVVEWVYGGYEKDGTYAMYEVASIDGVLMDGGLCWKLVYDALEDDWDYVLSTKPYIARYTGGYANPDVQWKAVWPELEYPFSVYERKMIKDNEGNWVWTDEFRPSGVYAKILPSFILTNSDLALADRDLKLVLTSPILPDFDISVLLGTDYICDGPNMYGSNTYIFDGDDVPAFQNTVIYWDASF